MKDTPSAAILLLQHISSFLFLKILPVILCTIIFSSSPSIAQSGSGHKSVLVIYGYAKIILPAYRVVNERMLTYVESEADETISIFTEYLDLDKMQDLEYLRLSVKLPFEQYKVDKPDAIVCVGVSSDFWTQHFEETFRGIPVVFTDFSKDNLQVLTNRLPQAKAVLMKVGHAETLEAALTLLPETEHVAVVSGVGNLDQFLEQQAKRDFKSFKDRVNFIYLSGLPIDQLLKKVTALPDNTVIIYLALSKIPDGRPYVGREVLLAISEIADIPTFGIFSTYLDYGIIGGNILSMELLGDMLGKITLQLLYDNPENIPPVSNLNPEYMFDWRELQRRGIKESALPPGSVVKFKKLTFWELYRRLIIIVLLVFLLQSLLIGLLLWNRKIRRKAIKSLQKSERNFQSFISTSLEGIFCYKLEPPLPIDISVDEQVEWACQNGIIEICNDVYAKQYGYHSGEELIGKPFVHLVGENEQAAREVIRTWIEKGYTFPASENEEEVRPGTKRWFLYNTTSIIQKGHVERLWGSQIDITERKRAEVALHNAEVKYRTVADFTYDWETWENPDGKFKYVSPSCERITGYTSEEFINNPGLIEDIIIAEDQQILENHRSRQKTKPGQKEIEFRICCKDGQTRWIEHACMPVYGENGKNLGFRGSNRDITDRKQAEESLQSIFRVAPTGIGVVKDRVLVEVNPLVCEITGYKKHELIGKSSRILYPTQEDFDFVGKEKYRQVTERGTGVVETRWEKKSGAIIDVLLSSTPIDMKDLSKGVIFTALDITKRKQAEEERLRLATIIEQAAEIIVVTDKEGIIQYVNPAFCTTTGYSPEEAIGQRPAVLKSGKHAPDYYEKMWSTITSGKTWKGHFINKKKDGNLFEEDATITPIKNAAGDIINYVAVKRDVTSEMKMQDQLRQAQKMESIGTLAGGIAHDFNNILGVIMGYTEMSLEDVKDKPTTYQSLQQVLEAAYRARDLVSQILTFSRSKTVNKVKIKTIPIVKEVCKFIRSSLPTTIEIKQHITAKNDWIMADPTQFHQILMNLCTNAGHAMKEMGGELEIRLEESDMDKDDLMPYPDLQPGAYLKLSVNDTGSGISTENLERIFEPYFTTKDLGEGTGLGLAVVHGIVKEYGGEIKVYSEEGQGTVFHVLFPLIKEAAEMSSVSSGPIPTGTESIMFVDDEALLVKLGTKMLERLGYKVTGFTSSEEALDLFKHSKDAYALIITDKTMPRMTGLLLAEEIKKVRPDIPILLCTGFQDKDLDDNIQKAGITGCVMKPINKRELAAAVRKALDKKNP